MENNLKTVEEACAAVFEYIIKISKDILSNSHKVLEITILFRFIFLSVK
jgi:hypothetical protein